MLASIVCMVLYKITMDTGTRDLVKLHSYNKQIGKILVNLTPYGIDDTPYTYAY